MSFGLHILAPKHLVKIAQLERDLHIYPYTLSDLAALFKNSDCRGIIAKSKNTICGYSIYEFCPWGVEIITVGVPLKYQRTGIGKSIIEYIKQEIFENSTDVKTVLTLVRETNLAAQLFFKSQGFVYCKTLKNHYNPPVEDDAYIFKWMTNKCQILT